MTGLEFIATLDAPMVLRIGIKDDVSFANVYDHPTHGEKHLYVVLEYRGEARYVKNPSMSSMARWLEATNIRATWESATPVTEVA